LILNICSGQYLSVKLGKRKTKRKKESLDLLWWLQTGQLLHLKFVIQTSVCVGPILIRGTILCYKCMYSHAWQQGTTMFLELDRLMRAFRLPH
jgi:hypothetical protein